jgi:hypothetical protein
MANRELLADNDPGGKMKRFEPPQSASLEESSFYYFSPDKTVT